MTSWSVQSITSQADEAGDFTTVYQILKFFPVKKLIASIISFSAALINFILSTFKQFISRSTLGHPHSNNAIFYSTPNRFNFSTRYIFNSVNSVNSIVNYLNFLFFQLFTKFLSSCSLIFLASLNFFREDATRISNSLFYVYFYFFSICSLELFKAELNNFPGSFLILSGLNLSKKYPIRRFFWYEVRCAAPHLLISLYTYFIPFNKVSIRLACISFNFTEKMAWAKEL